MFQRFQQFGKIKNSVYDVELLLGVSLWEIRIVKNTRIPFSFLLKYISIIAIYPCKKEKQKKIEADV